METVIESVGGKATQTTNATPTAKFGNGTYSNLGKECHGDLTRVFKLDDETATIAAKRIMSDVGACLSLSKRKVKVGKANDDGKVTLKESVSAVKGQTMTDALRCLRALNFANEAKDHGFDGPAIVWKADEKLQEWFDGLQ